MAQIIPKEGFRREDFPSSSLGGRMFDLAKKDRSKKESYSQEYLIPTPSTSLDPGLAGGMSSRLAKQMYSRATGQEPSFAQMQLQEGLGRQLAASRAMAASAPGMSPAIAQRLAADRASRAMAQTGFQAAQLRAQEQERAEQSMTQLLENQRRAELAAEQMRLQEHIERQRGILTRDLQPKDYGLLPTILSTGGAVLGAYLGGPAGAAAGYEAGRRTGQVLP